MHDKHPKEDPLIDMGYETRDINLPALAKAAIIFFAFTFVCYFAGIAIFKVNFIGQGYFNSAAVSQPFIKNPPPAPIPLLQTNITTKTDIRELRQNETAQLTTPAVMDAKKGVYRIPMDRAIDLVSSRGLPDTASAQGAKQGK